MTNLVLPKPFVTNIGGKDVSELVLEANGAYGQFSESGLILMSGSLKLGMTQSFDESLDDRLNARWRIGNYVSINIANQPASIIGTSFIDGARYDPQAQTLLLTLICKLSLANNASPEELGACFSVGGNGYPINSAITNTLARLGIASNVGAIPGVLRELEWLSNSQSLINWAGKLAYDNGFYLWQDAYGIVQASSLLNYNAQPTVAILNERDLPVYERLYQPELPPDIAYAEGELGSFLPKLNENENTETITATASGVQIVQEAIMRDAIERKNIIKTWTTMPMRDADPVGHKASHSTILDSYIFDEASYEKKSNSVGQNLENCVPDDPGRLYKRIQTTNGWRPSTFQEYYAIRKEFEKQNKSEPKESLNGNGIRRTELDIWEYHMPKAKRIVQSVGASAGSYFVRHIREICEPLGKLFPAIGDPLLGKPKSMSRLAFVDIDRLLISEKTIELWKLNTDERTWSYKVETYQSIFQAKQEAIQAMIASSLYSPLDIIVAGSDITIVSSQKKNIASPSSGGTWSAENLVEYIPYQRKLTFASNNPYARNMHISLSKNTGSIQIADSILASSAKLAWSRHKGQSIGFAYGDLLALLKPFSKIQVQEASGLISYYACDGPSIVIRPNEAVVQTDAAWLFSEKASGEIVQPVQPNADCDLPLHDREKLSAIISSTLSSFALNLPLHDNILLNAIVIQSSVPDNAILGEDASFVLSEFGDFILQEA